MVKTIRVKSNERLILCRKCLGTGNEAPDPIAGILSFGLIYLLESIDPEPCPKCHGRGYIKVVYE